MTQPEMLPISIWIETTPLHTFMVQNQIAFTFCETLHFMGLTILAGALLVIDLRGLGFLKRMPLYELHKLVPFAIGAFAVQLLTGLAFIFSNPNHYFLDLSFQVKMVLVVLAGLNALAFEFLVFRPMKAGVPNVESWAVTKITSGLSIALWAGVLICGRLIPYV
ncbi:MAG TPA: DUF6644 family protein [Caulobacteraceae bacterium]|jgi:hypothetical protein|nr:DUF6644 family protein [Caulobacteraceae bacterium]